MTLIASMPTETLADPAAIGLIALATLAAITAVTVALRYRPRRTAHRRRRPGPLRRRA